MQAAKHPKRLIRGWGCPGIVGFVRNGLSLLLGETRGFPKTRGTFLGVTITRIIACWVLYWGPPIHGNYHVGD